MFKFTVLALLSMAAFGFAQHSAIVELPDSIAAAGTTVQWVKKLPSYCEGPAIDAEGNLYFTQQSGNVWPVWKINPSNIADTGSIFLNTNQNNGLAFDAKGRLVVAQKGKIGRYLKNGTLDSVLGVSGSGATFGQANDLSLGTNGDIYFTDLASNIFYIDASRTLKTAITGLSGCNGIEWLEEQNAVYVFEGGKNQITRLDIQPNGNLGNAQKFITVTGPDGGDVDSHGNWYIGSYSQGAVLVFNAAAQQIGKISFKMTAGIYDTRAGDAGNICNCHFGGADRKTLYCTGDGGAYSIQLKIPGRQWASSVSINKLNYRNPIITHSAEYLADGKKSKPQSQLNLKKFKSVK